VPGVQDVQLAAIDEVALRTPNEPAAQAAPVHNAAPADDAHVPEEQAVQVAAADEIAPLRPK